MDPNPLPNSNIPIQPPVTDLQPSPKGSAIRRHKYWILSAVALIILLGTGGVLALIQKNANQNKAIKSAATSSLSKTKLAQNTPTKPKKVSKVNLATLPLGDGRHTSIPKVGYITTCQTTFNDPGGAFQAGPWIDKSASTWDATKKLTVSGNVAWPSAKETITESGSNLTVYTNALPNHRTGVFPIQSTDPAYQYDRNHSTIAAQDFNFSFPLNPVAETSPGCIRGEVGVTLSGAILFDGFDAGGRDAVAWELQDDCAGHPSSIYHYHGYSPCIPDSHGVNEHSALVGYAFDGFGIYGTQGEAGNELSTDDLDACHGHSHAVMWHGKTVTIYHYHMTRDFPYSVSCFKGKQTLSGPLAKLPTQ